MQRIVVTGGAGFIGSHLVERLLEQGHDVVVVDNYYTGRKQNLAHLMGNPHLELIRHDVSEELYLEVDEIYHLACPASPVYYQHNPIKTIKTSVLGTLHMLGMAKRNNAKLLLASTSEVYGDPQVSPQTESYWGHVNPIGPRACYDEGKRAAEALAMNYRQMHGVKIKIARIFNTYGPRMRPDDGRVVSQFIHQAQNNQPLTVHGSGQQTRAFCYVDDLVEGLLKLMATNDFCGPVNLGNPQPLTMETLARTLIELTGSQSKIEFVEGRPEDPVHRCPDITLAQTVLNWQPTTNLKTGLQKTIAAFQNTEAN